MHFAHAGHAHTPEVIETYESSDFTLGIILIAVAVLVLGYLVYDSIKSRKPKPKK